MVEILALPNLNFPERFVTLVALGQILSISARLRDHILPVCECFETKGHHHLAGDQVALDVELVVERHVGGEKRLG